MANALEQYKRRRSFERTPEPRGRRKPAKKKQLIFVVQKHDATRLHYDFRLEFDGVLKSWAVPKGPSMNPAHKRLAMPTEDHPLEYADFEETIPAGEYGAGEVIVWDRGTYHAKGLPDFEESYAKLKEEFADERLALELDGQKLKGGFALFRMSGKKEWLLVKQPDEFAGKEDVTRDTGSVLSNRQLARDRTSLDRKADPWPELQPMLATPVDGPFDREGWLFEPKYDGYRILARIKDGQVTLYSRKQQDYTEKYSRVARHLEGITHDCLLDGEVVARGKRGRTAFQALQKAGQERVDLIYYVFDLLYLDGVDLRSAPLSQRKELLAALLKETAHIKQTEVTEDKGIELFEKLGGAGGEGVIAKKADSPYQSGRRSRDWLKVKAVKRQKAVIGGFTEPRGSRKKFGALVLGVYDGDDLVYVGHTGTGFDEQTLNDVYNQLKPLIVKTSPFAHEPKTNMPATWVRPQLVAEIEFTEWTVDGQMRHPAFMGLRDDVDPHSIHRELPLPSEQAAQAPALKREPAAGKKDAGGPRLTNLDKVYWPELNLTKQDLIEYYDRMAGVMLPYLVDRPENLLRHPNGVEGKSFYQKNVEKSEVPPYADSIEIPSDSRKEVINYLICNNRETLLYLAQLGCIEINPWSSRVQTLDKPDFMIIDLDPGSNTFDQVVQVAQVIHKVLDLSCEGSFVKTSGKTGLHIVVPLGAQYTYDQIKSFAQLLMTIVHRRLPEITSLERSPDKRRDKIYLDYLQNRLGQTIAAPYSVRPTKEASVSTPLEWKEVRQGLDPTKFTLTNFQRRLDRKGDLWEGVLTTQVDLTEAIGCLEREIKK